MTTTTIDIATIVPWGLPTRVRTKDGERNLRKAPASDAFLVENKQRRA
jgi:hypothetical protein